MVQRFRVTPREMRNKANDLATLNNRFKNEVERLKQENQTLGRQWEGDARNKFNEEFNKDMQKFEEFYKGILTFIEKLRQNADAYDKVENTNRDIAAVRKA